MRFYNFRDSNFYTVLQHRFILHKQICVRYKLHVFVYCISWYKSIRLMHFRLLSSVFESDMRQTDA